MLKDIIEIIKNTDMELEMKLSSIGGGEICLVLMPLVGKVSDTASQAEKQLKAALSVPLKIKGTPEEVEESLKQRISDYQAPRQNWLDKARELDKNIRKAESTSNKTQTKARAASNNADANNATATAKKTTSTAKKTDATAKKGPGRPKKEEVNEAKE